MDLQVCTNSFNLYIKYVLIILLLLVAPHVQLRTKCQNEDDQSLLHCEGMHQPNLGMTVQLEEQFRESYLGDELRTELSRCV